MAVVDAPTLPGRINEARRTATRMRLMGEGVTGATADA
jgi:hypothetical protein